MRNWQSYEQQVESGPSGAFRAAVIAMVLLIALGSIGSCIGYTLGWFGDAAATVKQELAPSVLLKKYEWFKDASAALDAKAASLGIYERRFANLKAEYGTPPRPSRSRRRQGACIAIRQKVKPTEVADRT